LKSFKLDGTDLWSLKKYCRRLFPGRCRDQETLLHLFFKDY
jgi:hypothetical protein